MRQDFEIFCSFRSLQEWRAFFRSNKETLSADNLEEMVDYLRTNGFECPVWKDHASPEQVKETQAPYREGFVYRNINARLRAVYEMIIMESVGIPPKELKLYMPEAVTFFAKLIEKRFPNFIGSEYFESKKARLLHPLIREEDMHALSFENETFDMSVVNEIFEHLPDLPKAIGELARVTKKGGKVISTFPFVFNREDSLVKARLINGSIEHLVAEPEYHGNPVSGKGSLVFQVPGWEILEMFRENGFADARMVLRGSLRKGILANNVACIAMLVAVR